MVINNDPCYAYLLAANKTVDQKLVMAHVYGHADFFKNNYSFGHTNRKMVDEMANHASRVRRYMESYGESEVEDFLDVCLSLDNLIDYNAPHIRRRRRREPGDEVDRDHPANQPKPRRLAAKEYMEEFINPEDALEAEAERLREERRAEERFPQRPEKDVLLFLLEHAPLTNWQRDVLGIIREEAYYFAPQGQTKIMNEGWATYWHSTIMTEKALDDSELIDYADHHSGTTGGGSGRLNPYKLGLELFRDIEERWDKGRHGPIWEACDDFVLRRNWDTGDGKGREKIFQVRQLYNDVTFIDEFLTPEFCEKHKLFVYEYNEAAERYEISDRSFDEIKKKLLFQLTNFGQPWIEVGGRQPPQPRRAGPLAPVRGRAAEARLRPGGAGEPLRPVEAARPRRDDGRRPAGRALLRRDRAHGRGAVGGSGGRLIGWRSVSSRLAVCQCSEARDRPTADR